MNKFLEYDINSGQIVCILSADNPPMPANGFALLQIDDNCNIDTSSYAVRNGQLVKLFETNAERAEREKLRKEYYEQTRLRLKSLIFEFVVALLDDNLNAINELKQEYKKLKVYL